VIQPYLYNPRYIVYIVCLYRFQQTPVGSIGHTETGVSPAHRGHTTADDRKQTTQQTKVGYTLTVAIYGVMYHNL